MTPASPPLAAGSAFWQRFLCDQGRAMGLDISAGQAGLLGRHAAELDRWNKKINLTAITDPAETAVKHFLDSLAPAQWIPAGALLMDIGSGGGFPGLPLKIIRPDLRVILVEATGKKVSFLTQVIRLLELDGIQALHGRAEAPEDFPGLPGACDVVIGRALAALDKFVVLAHPFLRPDGRLIAMKQENPDHEIADLGRLTLGRSRDVPATDLFSVQMRDYRLPWTGDRRSLVILDLPRRQKDPAGN